MATLTIKIPNDAVIEVTELIERIGGKVIKETTDKQHSKNLIAEVEAELDRAFEILESKTQHTVYVEDLRNYIGVINFANKHFTEAEELAPAPIKKKRGQNHQ